DAQGADAALRVDHRDPARVHGAGAGLHGRSAGARALTVAALDGAPGLEMLPLLAMLVVILLGAKLGGSWFVRHGQSAVLGELLVGIVLGNLGLAGFHALDGARDLPSIGVLAQI